MNWRCPTSVCEKHELQTGRSWGFSPKLLARSEIQHNSFVLLTDLNLVMAVFEKCTLISGCDNNWSLICLSLNYAIQLEVALNRTWSPIPAVEMLISWCAEHLVLCYVRCCFKNKPLAKISKFIDIPAGWIVQNLFEFVKRNQKQLICFVNDSLFLIHTQWLKPSKSDLSDCASMTRIVMTQSAVFYGNVFLDFE